MPHCRLAVAALATLVLVASGCHDDSGNTPPPPPPPPPPVNHAPFADAGRDFATGTGWITTLDAGASWDPDGDALVLTWFQRSGPPVELSDNPDGTQRFVAPSTPVTLEFGLTVSDGTATAYDEVEVRVADPGNWPPVAHAGPDQQVPRRSVVTLSGSGEDREGDALTWLWEQVSGPPVALLDADRRTAAFVAPTTDMDLEFRLTVGDGFTNDWDTVIVQVRNHAPAAAVSIWPSVPFTTDDLVATASATDPDGDPISFTFAWLRNGAVLEGRTGAALPASESEKGDAVAVTVTASDGELTASAVAAVTIQDAPPFLSATVPAEVARGEPLSVEVTASDPDGEPVGELVLVFGPAGMTVSGGTLSWTPTLPMFDRTLDVSFAVAVAAQPWVRLDGTIRVVDADRAAPLRRTGIEIPSWQNGLAAGDLDGDGDAELLVGCRRGLFELAWTGDGYAQVWSYPFSPSRGENVAAVAARDLDGDGRQEIFFSVGETLLKLDGAERREAGRVETTPVDSYSVGNACTDLEVADLDGDGGFELICLRPSSSYSSWEASAKLVVLDAATLATEWETATLGLGRDLAVGQVDGDAALEIVTAGGFVFDGSSAANEWAYGPGFGRAVDTGDLDGDGIEEIVGAGSGKIVGYSATEKSPLWERLGTWPTSSPDSLLVGDLDGDGVLELGVGDTNWGPVVAYRYRPATNDLAAAFQAANPDGGASALAAADLDGDGALELVWGAGAGSSGEDVLLVAGPDAGGAWVTEWAGRDPSQLDGPFVGARPAAMGDGSIRLLFATANTDSGYEGTRIVALDPAGGALAVSPELGSNWNDSARLDTGDYDGDGVDEAFLTTADLYGGYFTAYDPALATAQWTSPPDLGNGRAVVATDLSGDGAPDLLAITSEGVLHAWDLKNQALLWKSVSLGGNGVDVAVADLDGDGAREIVALTTTRLVVYRRATGVVPWLERASAAVGGTDLEVADGDGDGVPELYVLSGSSWEASFLRRYDVNATLLGQIALDGTVRSLHVEDLGAPRQNLVVAVAGKYSWDPALAYLRAIDARTGDEIWRSPPLSGIASANSLRYVDADGDGDRELALGTGSAMYLTR